MEEQYHPIPQPDEIELREREDAMGGYFMMFASLAVGLPLPVLNLVAAVIYFYLNKSKSRFVHFHSLQSLISQLPTSLMNAGLVFWSVQIWIFENYDYGQEYLGYLILTAVANLAYIIFSIIGAIKARKGEFFYFVFFGKLAYHYAYRKKPEDEVGGSVNKAPFA